MKDVARGEPRDDLWPVAVRPDTHRWVAKREPGVRRRGARTGGQVVFDDGFRLGRQIFWPLAGLMASAAVPGMVVLLVGFFSLPDDVLIDIDVPAFVQTLMMTVIAFTACQAVFEPLSVACAYAAADRVYRRQSWSIADVLRQAWARRWPIIGVGAVYYGAGVGLFTVAVAGVGVIAAAGFVAATGALTEALLMALGGAVVGLTSGVGSVVVAVRYGFSLPEAVTAPETPMWATFARSAVLVRGAYGSTMLVLLILVALRFGLGFVAAQLVPAPNVLGLDEGAFMAALPALLRVQLLQQAATVLATSLFAIFAAACWIVLYHQRRSSIDPVDEGAAGNDQPLSASVAGTSATPADS